MAVGRRPAADPAAGGPGGVPALARLRTLYRRYRLRHLRCRAEWVAEAHRTRPVSDATRER